MLALGGLVGAIIAGRLAEYMGRRDAMFIINSTFFIGAILMGAATTSTMFIIGRVFVGIGSGSMVCYYFTTYIISITTVSRKKEN